MPRCRGSPDRWSYFLISWVARAYRVHPQTLRLYERAGLLAPGRSQGRTRLYAADDLARLEVVLGLTRNMGVNLAGVEVILKLREKIAELQNRIARLKRSVPTRRRRRRA